MKRVWEISAAFLTLSVLAGCGNETALNRLCENRNRAAGYLNEFDAKKAYESCMRDNREEVSAAMRDWPDYTEKAEALKSDTALKAEYQAMLTRISKEYDEAAATARQLQKECREKQVDISPDTPINEENIVIDCDAVEKQVEAAAQMTKEESLRLLGSYQEWAEQKTGLANHPWNKHDQDVQLVVRQGIHS